MNTTPDPPSEIDLLLTYDLTVDFQSTNIVFFYQQTALHIAARDGQERTVGHIVEGGADINIKDNNGVSYMRLYY